MPEQSPAEVLREAARLMRERANDVVSGRWETRTDMQKRTSRFVADQPVYRVIAPNEGIAICSTAEHAVYIASMHPAVGLAVAEWLEQAAAGYEQIVAGSYGEAGALFVSGLDGSGDPDPALTVARAYLGTQAGELSS